MESPEGTSYVSEGDKAKVPIQVECDGNQEEDYMLSRQSTLVQYRFPHSMVHGRPPLMKYAQNEEDEDKGGLQEANAERLVPGDRAAVIPEHYYRYPSDKEVEQFVPTVQIKLRESCDRFPTAHGLVVAFSNEVGCEKTDRIPNIHTSSETVCDEFSKLGYASCIFKECHKVEILAVYHELGRMTLPSSYNAIFIYFTGHGQKYHISTMDGYISINHLKNLLSDTSAPNLTDMVKVLFFDCCRTSAVVKGTSQSPSVENLIVFYTTPLGQQSFIVNDAGMSVATIELVKLLEREEQCTLTKLFSVDLCREVKAAVRRVSNGLMDLRTDFEGCLNRTIDLYKDKMRAMSATEVELTEDSERDMCTLTWKKPLHADHHRLIGYYIAFTSMEKQERTWLSLRDGISAAATSCELPRSQVSGKGLTVGARYIEVDVLAVHHGECPLMHLQSENIKPGNVRLNVSTSGEATLTWSSSASVQEDKQLVTIQRRDGGASKESDGDWVVIEDKIQVEGNSYPIAAENAGEYDYRLMVHAGGMGSHWVPAEKCTGHRCIGQRLKDARLCSARCCMLTVFITLCVASLLFLGIAYAVVYASFRFTVPRHNYLAVGGDVIDCERLEPWQKWFYADVSVTQQVTDVINDNKKGLTMKIMPIQMDKLIFHPLQYSGTVDVEITNTTVPFVIPEGYFNRPFYMWEGSNITMHVNLSDYEIPPSEMMAYIILGDENFNSFISSLHSKPHYEHSFNLIGWDREVYHQTLHNHGYYYIVVQVQTEHNIHLFADIQFDFFYVDSDDYDFSQASDSEIVGKPVHSSFGIHDQEITVCSVEEEAGDLDSNTIHVLLDYDLRASVVFVIPLSMLFIISLFFLLFCVRLLIARYRTSRCQATYHVLEQYN